MSATQWTTLNGEYLWHLDRIDELSWADRDLKHNMCTEGRTVYAYVIDTGVWRDHPELEPNLVNRVVKSIDFSDDRTDPLAVYTDDVTNGCSAGEYADAGLWHGTAVASVLAGTNVGAAKTQVVSLKVAECITRRILVADLIDATNWIADWSKNPYYTYPGVINHSGFVPKWGPSSDFSAYSEAVARLVSNTGKPFFTSADNYSADSCKFSPGDKAITNTNKDDPNTRGTVFVVAGTTTGPTGDNNDYRWQRYNTDGTPVLGRDGGSNGGSCVSAYGPAASIYAARNGEFARFYGVEYAHASGTSFSAPLAAAMAARYMEKHYNQYGFTPGQASVYLWLLSQSYATIGTSTTPVTTPTYWMSVGATSDLTWTSNPPATCPDGYVGDDGGTTPLYFPSVGNEPGAKMIYWDEGVGHPEGECP